MLSYIQGFGHAGTIALILGLAVAAHLLVRLVRVAGTRAISTPAERADGLLRRRPRVATLTTLVVSTTTFAIYFAAVGFILRELGVNLTAYLASASVIALAVGFGSQGLVQDVVLGLTLIFSDVLNVGDVADVGGQTGRVESIGLRFTTLTTLLGQRVHVPNRNILQISRYRKGHVRAYVDFQVPAGRDPAAVEAIVLGAARGMRAQFGGIILAAPESLGVRSAGDGAWSFVRLKFRLWPGQGALIETTFRQRALALLRAGDDEYADWMVTVVYHADGRVATAGADLPR